MGLQRVGHDWVTELNWTQCKGCRLNNQDANFRSACGSVTLPSSWPDLNFLTCKMVGVGVVSETPTILSFKESYLWEAEAPEACGAAGSLSEDDTTEEEGRLSDAISRPWLLDATLSLWLSCNLRKLDLLTMSLPLLSLHCSSIEPVMRWVLAGRQVCTLSTLLPSKLFPCLLYQSASHPSAGA